MKIEDLKKSIEDKTINNNLIIFVYKDNSFIANQYIDEIAKIKNKSISYIEEIDFGNDFFGVIEDNTIKVLYTDTFNCNNKDLTSKQNYYIICKKNECEFVKDYIVELPKLENWQIKDYVYSIATGVDQKDLDELLEICKYDIYRIDNELKKILLFPEKVRGFMFKQFIDDSIFNDISKYNIFQFTNAIMKKDIATVTAIYKEMDRVDITDMYLLTVLRNNFSKMLAVQLANNPTPESLGMKPNQFWAIKYTIGAYTKEQIVEVYRFLTGIDKRVKLGDMPMEKLVDYMVTYILTV